MRKKTFAKNVPYPHCQAGLITSGRKQDEVDDKAFLIGPGKKCWTLLSFMTADGKLNWNVPEGRLGNHSHWYDSKQETKNSPASPEATGYEVDKNE